MRFLPGRSCETLGAKIAFSGALSRSPRIVFVLPSGNSTSAAGSVVVPDAGRLARRRGVLVVPTATGGDEHQHGEENGEDPGHGGPL